MDIKLPGHGHESQTFTSKQAVSDKQWHVELSVILPSFQPLACVLFPVMEMRSEATNGAKKMDEHIKRLKHFQSWQITEESIHPTTDRLEREREGGGREGGRETEREREGKREGQSALW